MQRVSVPSTVFSPGSGQFRRSPVSPALAFGSISQKPNPYYSGPEAEYANRETAQVSRAGRLIQLGLGGLILLAGGGITNHQTDWLNRLISPTPTETPTEPISTPTPAAAQVTFQALNASPAAGYGVEKTRSWLKEQPPCIFGEDNLGCWDAFARLPELNAKPGGITAENFRTHVAPDQATMANADRRNKTESIQRFLTSLETLGLLEKPSDKGNYALTSRGYKVLDITSTALAEHIDFPEWPEPADPRWFVSSPILMRTTWNIGPITGLDFLDSLIPTMGPYWYATSQLSEGFSGGSKSLEEVVQAMIDMGMARKTTSYFKDGKEVLEITQAGVRLRDDYKTLSQTHFRYYDAEKAGLKKLTGFDILARLNEKPMTYQQFCTMPGTDSSDDSLEYALHDLRSYGMLEQTKTPRVGPIKLTPKGQDWLAWYQAQPNGIKPTGLTERLRLKERSEPPCAG